MSVIKGCHREPENDRKWQIKGHDNGTNDITALSLTTGCTEAGWLSGLASGGKAPSVLNSSFSPRCAACAARRHQAHAVSEAQLSWQHEGQGGVAGVEDEYKRATGSVMGPRPLGLLEGGRWGVIGSYLDTRSIYRGCKGKTKESGMEMSWRTSPLEGRGRKLKHFGGEQGGKFSQRVLVWSLQAATLPQATSCDGGISPEEPGAGGAGKTCFLSGVRGGSTPPGMKFGLV